MKIKVIRECSNFLVESKGNPLIKYLPKNGPDQRKIKVRKGKKPSTFDNLFNNVFIDHPNLRQRCVFCNGVSGISKLEQSEDESLDCFYIFPVDGFEFIYSPIVFDSSIQYKDTLQKFIEVMGECDAIETFSEVLKYDYTSSDLIEGIQTGCEIIVYSIPYYYAIRKSSVQNYSTLFSL